MGPTPSDPTPSGDTTLKQQDDAYEDQDELSACTPDDMDSSTDMIMDSSRSISLLSYDELRLKYDELSERYDGLKQINNELTVELACLKRKTLDVDGKIFADAPEDDDAASEDAEDDAKRPKVDYETSWVYMHEELIALRGMHADLKKRYAQDMADAVLSMLELRQNYDKYIKWITEEFKQLKQAPLEGAPQKCIWAAPPCGPKVPQEMLVVPQRQI